MSKFDEVKVNNVKFEGTPDGTPDGDNYKIRLGDRGTLTDIEVVVSYEGGPKRVIDQERVSEPSTGAYPSA